MTSSNGPTRTRFSSPPISGTGHRHAEPDHGREHGGKIRSCCTNSLHAYHAKLMPNGYDNLGIKGFLTGYAQGQEPAPERKLMR